MSISSRLLFKNAVWAVGAYGFNQSLRVVTSIITARLLAPELFEIMVIVNSLRSGLELLSDVGINQNIIYQKDANNPDFYNTAWTLQAIRSLAIWLMAAILAVPFARFYNSPVLLAVIPLVAFTSVLAGFSSVSLSLLQKRLRIARLNAFDATMAFTGSAALILFAYLSPTIWSFVFGILFGSTVSMICSHFLLPDIKQRFQLSKRYVWEILRFGKWIFVSSIVYFLSSNFDQLYLAKVASFGVVGVYGIARSISDLMGASVLRLGSQVLFPLIASNSSLPRSALRQQLAGIRAKFLLVAGFGFSIIAAMADLPIRIFYDARYQAAGWMLPLLIIGSWFSILAYINEYTLLGLGKPLYSAIANTSKFVFLLIGLPAGVNSFGLLGAVMVMVVSDLFRYFPILIGQKQERFSFATQDLLATLFAFSLVGVWEFLRWSCGFGNSFETLPIDFGAFLARRD